MIVLLYDSPTSDRDCDHERYFIHNGIHPSTLSSECPWTSHRLASSKTRWWFRSCITSVHLPTSMRRHVIVSHHCMQCSFLKLCCIGTLYWQLQQNLERAREKAVLIVDEEPPFSLEAIRIHIAGVHPTSVSYVVKLGEPAGCNFPTEVYNFIWLRFTALYW